MAGSEAGLIIGVRHARSRDVEWPATLMAVMSTVLLSAGVLRHYWDIYKQRTVRGISFIFVGIDAAGDVFSLLSVCQYDPVHHNVWRPASRTKVDCVLLQSLRLSQMSMSLELLSTLLSSSFGAACLRAVDISISCHG